ncbi:Cof-type HAD-IIB family hydrolase [Spiroplasma tabanidicola]|uniref:HAD superfamily hydrolase n=1 Tax=Spiroplasma tabanidicola TaxID=324079 RepID=A0A6I6C823_9MOLU|nr:Cof-type HAD-IIB family hydrolase [Spiroplasma tabanidicola]QGS51579.1 HAD superfamily hydrolase [Spiroplasma tabanidicola]
MKNINKEKVIIFIDLDGTSLMSNHLFSQTTIDVVKKLYKNGHYIIPITARSTKDAIFQQAIYLGLDKLGGIAVANNGTHIYDFKINSYIRKSVISREMIEKVFNQTYGKIGKYKVHYFADDITYVYGAGEDSRYWSDIMKVDYKIVKDLVEIESAINHLTIILDENANDYDRNQLYKDFSFIEPELQITQYTRRVYELCAKGINKGEAIEYILNHLGYNQTNCSTFCFGDSVNDIPMFKVVQYPIAMANAIDDIKGIAKFVTLSNDEDGVAKFIEEHIL